MMMESILLKFGYFILFLQTVQPSHFRGAIITWKPGKTPLEVVITYRVSWRRSYSSDLRCTSTDIENKKLFPGKGALYYDNADIRRTSITNGYFICTDFSTREDWVTGELAIAYNATDDVFKIGFNNQAWIRLKVGGDGWWNVWTSVNLTRRADTGKINSSPITSTAPIVRIQAGCYHAISIRVSDPDGDLVRCRIPHEYSECGSICNGLPGAILDEAACILYYNATGGAGMYGVAIQIEDFASRLDTKPLSSVGLQFLINVFESSQLCDTQPRFSIFTRADKACVGVSLNETYRERFYATSGSAEEM